MKRGRKALAGEKQDRTAETLVAGRSPEAWALARWLAAIGLARPSAEESTPFHEVPAEQRAAVIEALHREAEDREMPKATSPKMRGCAPLKTPASWQLQDRMEQLARRMADASDEFPGLLPRKGKPSPPLPGSEDAFRDMTAPEVERIAAPALLPILSAAARLGDESLAALLEQVASLVRSGKHREVFHDEPRLAIRHTVQGMKDPLSIGEIESRLSASGIRVSAKFISTECRRLGRKIRARGSH